MKTKTARTTMQQGDVLAIKLDRAPKGERKNIIRKRLVVAHGESGHSHVIDDASATMFQIGETFYLELEKAATITHEEHKAITLEPGVWEVGRVVEYDYFTQMARQVVD